MVKLGTIYNTLIQYHLQYINSIGIWITKKFELSYWIIITYYIYHFQKRIVVRFPHVCHFPLQMSKVSILSYFKLKYKIARHAPNYSKRKLIQYLCLITYQLCYVDVYVIPHILYGTCSRNVWFFNKPLTIICLKILYERAPFLFCIVGINN